MRLHETRGRPSTVWFVISFLFVEGCVFALKAHAWKASAATCHHFERISLLLLPLACLQFDCNWDALPEALDRWVAVKLQLYICLLLVRLCPGAIGRSSQQYCHAQPAALLLI